MQTCTNASGPLGIQMTFCPVGSAQSHLMTYCGHGQNPIYGPKNNVENLSYL